MAIQINLSQGRAALYTLRAGETVLLSGTIFTARDAAHKRLVELLRDGAELPIDLRGAIIYYAGPTATPPGRVTGSIGPTTSSRMDAYTPELLGFGMAGAIGKGPRSDNVTSAFIKAGAIYFAAVGGAGALLSERVKSSCVVAFEDLGAEAIRRLEIEDFPVTVAIDCGGNDIYKDSRAAYLKTVNQQK